MQASRKHGHTNSKSPVRKICAHDEGANNNTHKLLFNDLSIFYTHVQLMGVCRLAFARTSLGGHVRQRHTKRDFGKPTAPQHNRQTLIAKRGSLSSIGATPVHATDGECVKLDCRCKPISNELDGALLAFRRQHLSGFGSGG